MSIQLFYSNFEFGVESIDVILICKFLETIQLVVFVNHTPFKEIFVICESFYSISLINTNFISAIS